jgi:hypothetical protein
VFAPKAVDVVEDPALVVAEKSMPIDPDIRHVSANIALEKDSSPIQMRIVFESSAGAVVGVKSLTVKQSSRKGCRIPEGSAKVRFIALKERREDSPAILSFAPSASVK